MDRYLQLDKAESALGQVIARLRLIDENDLADELVKIEGRILDLRDAEVKGDSDPHQTVLDEGSIQ